MPIEVTIDMVARETLETCKAMLDELKSIRKAVQSLNNMQKASAEAMTEVNAAAAGEETAPEEQPA